MLSLTECVREIRNDALWDTHYHSLFIIACLRSLLLLEKTSQQLALQQPTWCCSYTVSSLNKSKYFDGITPQFCLQTTVWDITLHSFQPARAIALSLCFFCLLHVFKVPLFTPSVFTLVIFLISQVRYVCCFALKLSIIQIPKWLVSLLPYINRFCWIISITPNPEYYIAPKKADRQELESPWLKV